MDEQQIPVNGPAATPHRPRSGRTRRVLGGVALTAAVAAGGLTIAAVNPLGIAGAQDNPAPSTQSANPNPSTPGAAARHGRLARDGSKVLDTSLAALVKDGTLTQAQADAVKAKVAETATTLRTERTAQRRQRRQQMETTAAAALGMSAADLRTDLQAGRTLAQVAQAKGVDVKKVTDALVADADRYVDQAVADGKLDAAQAATRKQQAAERIQSLVENGPKHSRMRPGADAAQPQAPVAGN